MDAAPEQLPTHDSLSRLGFHSQLQGGWNDARKLTGLSWVFQNAGEPQYAALNEASRRPGKARSGEAGPACMTPTSQQQARTLHLYVSNFAVVAQAAVC